jgi:hypothetical protein
MGAGLHFKPKVKIWLVGLTEYNSNNKWNLNMGDQNVNNNNYTNTNQVRPVSAQ